MTVLIEKYPWEEETALDIREYCLINDYFVKIKKEVIVRKIDGPFREQHGEYYLVRIVWQDRVGYHELLTRCKSSVAEGIYVGNQVEVELYFGIDYVEILQMKKIDNPILDNLQEMVIDGDLPYLY